jgi:4-hydroxyproline epimerase
VAYGGNFYAIIEPQENYRDLDDISAFDIQKLSPIFRRLVNEKYAFTHPENPTITGLRQCCGRGGRTTRGDARNAVFYGEKAIDRLLRTGTSSWMAQLARGELKVGDSCPGRSSAAVPRPGRGGGEGRRVRRDRALGRRTAWITGHNTIYLDDRDPS